MFEEAKQKGYTKEWQDEAIVVDKCNRCLETWADIELGISTEADFEKERNGLYRVVVRIAEKDPRHNALINVHRKVLEVAKIRTARDKRLKVELTELLQRANCDLARGENMAKVKTELERAHEISDYLGRPQTLYDSFVEVGTRRHFIVRREFKL